MTTVGQDSSIQRKTCGYWLLPALILGADIPLFLCQHLTPDAVLYDLQARLALDGGVLYRDIVEPNFPGIVWVHMLVRTVAGWSTVALRAFDLLVVTGIGLLLCRLIRDKDEPMWSARSAVLLAALFGLYFSLTEWCHCQRDVWMLLPALGAVCLRARQMENAHPSEGVRRRMAGAAVEGCLWGIAFWLKPHVAVPALVVIGASFLGTSQRRRMLPEFAGILGGGILVGALGSVWLIHSGAWPHFWEMQLEWNPEYLRAGRRRLTFDRFESIWQSFAPWSWLHLIAIAASMSLLRHHRTESSAAESPERTLVSALYLGWLTQAMMLQHPFAYVQMPPMMLAVAVVGGIRVPRASQPLARTGVWAFALVAIMGSAAFSPTRLAHWGACLRHGPTPELRAAIQLERSPNWRELTPVLEYLAKMNLHDGELTVYPGTAVTIYRELNLRPSTRYVYLDALARLFPRRVDNIREAVEGSSQKYIVSSLRDAGMADDAIGQPSDPTTGLPPCFPIQRLAEFPYTQPIVFRSGAYCVHRCTGPTGPICTEYLPLRNATPAVFHRADVQVGSTEIAHANNSNR